MFARLALFAQSTTEAAADAAASTAESSDRRLEETFQFGRLINFLPLHYALLALAIVAILGVVLFIYKRDSVELGWLTATVLVLLRLGTFVGLLWIFLLPQFRVDQVDTLDSRVLVLIDTSSSMQTVDPGAATSRMQQVVAALRENKLIQELRKKHQVVVMKFDAATDTVETFGKLPGPGEDRAAPPLSGEAQPKDPAQLDWETALQATGGETRLGQSLRTVIEDNLGNPTLAGIVLVSDGGHNTGEDPEAAVRRATDRDLKIYTIGLGSLQREMDYWIDELVVPKTVYQGPDEYEVTVVVNGQGIPPTEELYIDLFKVDAGQELGPNPEPLESRPITLPGQAVTETFELAAETPGTFDIIVKLRSNLANVLESKRMSQVGRVTVVDHKLRVLLFASGPTREYRFLGNQLRRDKSMIVDVLLQTAQHDRGISQDANKVLQNFPEDKAELLEYDCIVCFDPNWEELSEEQVAMLYEWVDKRAGGLIVIPGPVHTDDWVHTSVRDATDKLKALYPVLFHERFMPGEREFSNTEARRVQISPDRLDDRYIWVADDKGANERVWAEFEGVFGFYAVPGAKKGAVIVSTLESSETELFGPPPVYMAWHFFGSGRVFFLGSGEMWRLRSIDVAHYESFYTKLIRFVSQGALQRGATKRGMMFLDNGNKYQLGDTVPVRAKLEDAAGEPYLGNVSLEVLGENGELRSVPLPMVEGEPGHFRGQFTADRIPRYILKLAIPDSDDVLEDYIEVEEPKPEKKDPTRNDAVLAAVAGDPKRVYIGFDAALAFAQLAEVAREKVFGQDSQGQKWAQDMVQAFNNDKAQTAQSLQSWRQGLSSEEEKATADRLIAYVAEKQQPAAAPPLAVAIEDKSQEQKRLDTVKRLWDNQWTLLIVVGLLCLEWLIRRLNKLA